MSKFQADKYFEAYSKTVESYDLDAIIRFYNLPCIIINKGITSVFNEKEDLEVNFTKMHENHKQIGFLHASVLKSEVTKEISDNIVEVYVEWEYTRKIEEEPYIFALYYTLVNYGKGPQIVSVLTANTINSVSKSL